jgi:peroxiredoxin
LFDRNEKIVCESSCAVGPNAQRKRPTGKYSSGICCFLLLLTTVLSANGRAGQREGWSSPPPTRAITLVARAQALAERNELSKALVSARQAVAIAPTYLKAHLAYIRIRVNFLGQFDQAKAEYDSLILREPDNPVYLFASAITGLRGNDPRDDLRKVVQIAPTWAWADYSRGVLAQETDYESALLEFLKCIEQDKTADRAYYKVISIQAQRLNKIDDAIKTAEHMSAEPDLHTEGLLEVWRLRFLKAQGDPTLVMNLKAELKQLALTSYDVPVLVALYRTFADVIKDESEARSVEDLIHNVDPSWYPERGMALLAMPFNESGFPHVITLANWQLAIFDRANSLRDDLEPKERIIRLEHLLTLKPNREVRWYLAFELYRVARKLGDRTRVVKYGELSYSLDRSDKSLLADMALSLADRETDWQRALQLARSAEKGTVEFDAIPKPSNISVWDFEQIFPERFRLANYRMRRARALESLGWVMCQMGACARGEIKLREAISLERTEQSLTLLAKVLFKLGRPDEAGKISTEAKNEFDNQIKSRFENQPGRDFELTTIDGLRVALSDLKGKVVMLSFWATWCGPCATESPLINDIYVNHKREGFEVLGISVDGKETKGQVREFVKEHNISYPILFDDGVATLYDVTIYPTVIFVDRRGTVRYTARGYGVDSPRELAFVAAELLKEQK